MAITNVQVATATPVDGGTSISKAFGSNVTAGNIIIVSAVKSIGSVDAFVAGDCTKSAGTATIGAITLDKSADHNPAGSDHNYTGVWSCQVTGSGSCTMQVGGATAGSFLLMFIAEFHTDTGGASIVVDTGIAASDNSGASSGTAADSGSVTPSAYPAVLLGQLAVYSSTNPTTLTPDAAFSEIGEEQNGNLHAVGSAIYRIMTSGSDSASWTITSKPWSAQVQSYKESGSETITPDKWLPQERVIRGQRYTVMPTGMTPPQKIN